MIGLEARQNLARNIHAAQQAGARLKLACATAGIDVRTLQRWKARDGLMAGDGRPAAQRPVPAHALSPAERAEVLRVANEVRFADVPPARIVPMLADEGVYLASESTFARILREHGQNARRGRAKAPATARPPTTHIATAPRQVWCWDMTYLPATVAGRWFYLYLILDLYSRKIVGWEVHETDAAEHAAHLVRRTALAEGIAALDAKPVLHGDNGATGARQDSCRLIHAAKGCLSVARDVISTTESRSGLSVTTPMGSQLRVWRDQRFGLRCRASAYSACRAARIARSSPAWRCAGLT